MPKVFIDDLRGGLNKVFPPHQIEPNQLSVADNINWRDGRWKRRAGYTRPFSALTDTEEVIEIWDTIKLDGTTNLLAASTHHIYSLNGTSWIQEKIHTTPLLTTQKAFHTEIQGNFYYTDGVNPVQVATTFGGGGNNFSDVNWETTTGARDITTAKIVLAFNSRLLLFNIDDTTDGAVPYRIAWTEVKNYDRVENVNFNDLDSSNTPIINARILGRGLIAVYKTDSVHIIQDTGDPLYFVPRFSTNVGLLAPKAVADWDNGHVFVSNTGIKAFLAGGIQDLGSERIDSYFFSNLNFDKKDNIYCLTDWNNKEVIIFYPTGTNDQPDKALVWNWEIDAWSEWDYSAYCGFNKYRTENTPLIYYGTANGNTNLSGGVDDNGVSITSDLQTRAFNNKPTPNDPNPQEYIAVTRVEADVKDTANANLKVSETDLGTDTPDFTTDSINDIDGKAPFLDIQPRYGRYIILGADSFNEISSFVMHWENSGHI